MSEPSHSAALRLPAGALVIDRRRLPQARVLARAWAAHHPATTLTVLLLDPLDTLPELPGGARVVVPDDVGLDADTLGILGALHGPEGLPAAVAPRLLRTLGDGPLVALTADTVLLGPLEELATALTESDVVVTPTTLRPPPDRGRDPEPARLLARVGVIDRGLLGVNGQTAAAESLYARWPRAVIDTDPQSEDPDGGSFQRWLDALPATSPDIGVLRHPGYGVGWWNADQRALEDEGGGAAADGLPLRTLQLTGFDPDRPELLALDQDRVLLSDEPVLARLVARHVLDLQAEGRVDDERPRSWTVLPRDVPLNPIIRRLLREGMDDGVLTRSPFAPPGDADFLGYLNAPGKAGKAAGITRYLYALWRSRRELQGAYPMLDGPDAPGFAGWAWVHGTDVVPEALLPPKPEHVAIADGDPTRRARGFGVNVAGFFSSELGLGEAARLLMGGLDAARVPALALQGVIQPPSRQRAEFAAARLDAAPFGISILCMNGDTIPHFAREAGDGFFRDRHTIALWWWELGELPSDWLPAFSHVDEIWVATEHIYKAVAPQAPVPVVKVPLPVALPPVPAYTRAELGLPGGYLFLFMHDYHSTSSRKNPLGVVEAFKAAFPPGSGASLVVKSINGDRMPEQHEAVGVAAAAHPDVHLIDSYVSADEKNGMLAACDCYVSLHRSEGFGLTPAEAMYLGKPVIATRYGGVMDFMTDENGYLVDHGMVRVGERAHPYPADAEWAEPDLGQAARLMAQVRADPAAAAAVGRRAARDIRATNAPAVAGAAMRRRIEAIHDTLPERAPGPVQPPRDETEVRLGSVYAQLQRGAPAPSPGRLAPVRRGTGKAVSKLTAPQVHHERQVTFDLASTVAGVHAELRTDVGGLRADLLAEMRRVRAELKALRLRADAAAQHVHEHETLPALADGHGLVLHDRPGLGRSLGFDARRAAEHGVRRAFADVFRGDEAAVRAAQAAYVPLLGDGPVLDLGCGRGELLELLRDHGVAASGVEADAGVAELALAKGLDVTVGDALERLRSLPDASLGAVAAIQLVQSIAHEDLDEMFALAHARLRPGGALLIETANPHHVPAMKAFWVDPAHRHPVFPEALLVRCRAAGFAAGAVFHPTGIANVEADRVTEPVYALIAAA